MRKFFYAAIMALTLFGAASESYAQPRGSLGDEAVLAPERAANGNLLFYRRVSGWEKGKLLQKRGLFVTPGAGESFVSTSRAYVDGLGERHPKDYEHLMVIEVSPEVMKELEKVGMRAPGPLLEKLYPRMPEITKNQPGAVHFKTESGALNLGFRKESIDIFNKHIVKMTAPAEGRFKIKEGTERDLKEVLRRRAEEAREAKTRNRTGASEILERRVSERTKDKDKDRPR